MPDWFTPPQVARSRRVRVGKVLAWIRAGELCAVNCAQRRDGRPRWRISAGALAAFDAARSNRAMAPAVPPPRRKRRGDEGVVEYF